MTVLTDVSGRYVADGLRPRTYTVCVEASLAARMIDSCPAGAPVLVAAGAAATADVTLTASAWVTGRVVDDDGGWAGTALVELDGAAGHGWTLSDGNGLFSLRSGVGFGRVHVVVTPLGDPDLAAESVQDAPAWDREASVELSREDAQWADSSRSFSGRGTSSTSSRGMRPAGRRRT